MALQAQVLENGEYVTRELDVRELFRATATSKSLPRKGQPWRPPTDGILTTTIAESPCIRWVVPAQIRSEYCNDVALVGDNAVQICEIIGEQLHHVTRKLDFGARIRNAVAVGSQKHSRRADVDINDSKAQDDDVEMTDHIMSQHRQPPSTPLPPQFLVLVLENGFLVFLYLKNCLQDDGGFEFVMWKHRPTQRSLIQPGYHVTVDPGGRYLALSSLRNNFWIYELFPMETLQLRHSQGKEFNPVKTCQAKSTQAVVTNMEFLHPNPEDDFHVILMMILVQGGAARLAIYDWEQGDQLLEAMRERRDLPLNRAWGMPRLVIPLVVRHGFILITEHSSHSFLDGIHKSWVINHFDLGEHERTDLHVGAQDPLWTAWSKPFREPPYLLKHDNVLLGRQDGIVMFLEISVEDGLCTSKNMGSVGCSIDTAFAAVYTEKGDLFIAGGESTSGAIWKVYAREPFACCGSIPNWSPTVDMAIVSPRDQVQPTKNKNQRRLRLEKPHRPDRVFTCSCRGEAGAIVEHRFGVEARLGGVFDCQIPLKQAWILPRWVVNDDAKGSCVLLSSLNRSDLLLMNDTLNLCTAQPQAEVSLDLSCSTLALKEYQNTVVQVTTSSLTIITSTQTTRLYANDIAAGANVAIVEAAFRDDAVALALYVDARFVVRTVSLDFLSGSILGAPYDVDGDVSCITLAHLSGYLVMLVGLRRVEGAVLAAYPAHDQRGDHAKEPLIIDLNEASFHKSILCPPLANARQSNVDALTSIVASDELAPGVIDITMGTISGQVLSCRFDASAPRTIMLRQETYGSSSVTVFPLSNKEENFSFLVCCESELTMARYSTQDERIVERHRVCPTDVMNPGMNVIPLDSVSLVRPDSPVVQGRVPLVLVSGYKFCFAELHTAPKSIPRRIDLRREPTKIMYCPRLSALAVAVIDKGRPALLFIDPNTGEDLSSPRDSKDSKQVVAYISGLGEENSAILSLTSWILEKEGKKWEYIVASMRNSKNEGQALITLAYRDDDSLTTEGSPRVKFWTQHRFPGRSSRSNSKPKSMSPIWSVATEENGLFFCSGKKIYYETLDSEKKFVTVKVHELASPAIWMEAKGSALRVVTTKHSMEILDYKSAPNETAMIRLHTDSFTKECLHAMHLGSPDGEITLVSDIYSGIWGLWRPSQHERPLQVAFHAGTPASIRRLTRSRTRPALQMYARKAHNGIVVPTSPDESDVIGIGIDGSLHHITVLSYGALRVFIYIQDLVTNPDAVVDAYDGAAAFSDSSLRDPRKRHVNGDVIKRCQSYRFLTDLFQNERPDATERIETLRLLLDALARGRYTEGFRDKPDLKPYLQLTHEIVVFCLASVF